MTLTSVAFRSNIGLGKTQAFRADDNFRPDSFHDPQYRIGGIPSQAQNRPCVIYSYNNSPMEKITTFGGRVRAARKALKLNQSTLAKLAGVSQTTVSDIERGRNENSKDLVSIAKVLKRSPEYLLTGIEAKPPSAADEVMALWNILTLTEREEIKARVRHNLEVLEGGTKPLQLASNTEAEALAARVIWLFNNLPDTGREMLHKSIDAVHNTFIKDRRKQL